MFVVFLATNTSSLQFYCYLYNDIQPNPGPGKNPGNWPESLDDQFLSLNQLKLLEDLTIIHLDI